MSRCCCVAGWRGRLARSRHPRRLAGQSGVDINGGGEWRERTATVDSGKEILHHLGRREVICSRRREDWFRPKRPRMAVPHWKRSKCHAVIGRGGLRSSGQFSWERVASGVTTEHTGGCARLLLALRYKPTTCQPGTIDGPRAAAVVVRVLLRLCDNTLPSLPIYGLSSLSSLLRPMPARHPASNPQAGRVPRTIGYPLPNTTDLPASHVACGTSLLIIAFPSALRICLL